MCVRALIVFDAEVNIFNKDNKTPLDLAEEACCIPVMDLLRDLGGLDSHMILAECQMAEEVDFKPMIDPDVLNMDALSSELTKIKENGTFEVGCQGEEGGKMCGNDHSRIIQDKMAVTPEGKLCTVIYR